MTATRLVLGDGIPTIEVDGEPNPHFWLDPTPRGATTTSRPIVGRPDGARPGRLGDLPGERRRIRASSRRWTQRTRRPIATIPEANRKLVTFHDAFPYFARHYGFELVGVILPNVGQEPSASELAALVDKVKAAGVKAVFSEAQFSPELAHTLAQEAGITTVVTTLYNDTVGPPPADTYLKMMAWNTSTRSSECRALS